MTDETRDDEMLSVADVARIVAVDPKTVRRWLQSGRLRGTKLGPGDQDRWRVPRGILTEFQQGRKQLLVDKGRPAS